MDYKSFVSRSVCNLNIDESLALSGTLHRRLSDYSAYHYRQRINETANVEESIKDMEENSFFSFSNVKIEGLDSLKKRLDISFDVASENAISRSGDLIYFSPSIDRFFRENPFKLDKREFPVEFNYPYVIQRVYSITIPESFDVKELPARLAASLPNDAASYRYQIDRFGNTLTINSMISINKSLFLPNEYESLKHFFQMIVDKEDELVVMKKI